MEPLASCFAAARRRAACRASAHRAPLSRALSSSSPPPTWSTPPLPPASLAQRAALALGSAVVAFIDPARADMVALLGEVTGEPALRRMRDRMAAEPEGAALLVEQPRIRLDSPALAALREAPPGSFGAAYAAYLDAHGFSPDERHEVRAVADPQLRYVLQRYREVHDFWHVLSGLPPSVLGEVAVKWLRTAAEARNLMAVRYEAMLHLPLEEVRRALRFTPAPPLL
jgi:ubiquinone biosynthesis protein COQ4